MDSPVLIALLFLPLVAAACALVAGRWSRAVAGGGAVTAMVLLVLLALAGRGSTAPVFDVAVRAFTLRPDVRGALSFLYAGLLAISLLATLWPEPRTLIPSGLAAATFLAAALMIEPFSFGAIMALGAIAVLLPALVAGRYEAAKYAWRAFLLAALAATLLIFVDWLVSSGQAGSQVAWLALLGAALLFMGAFPFQLWVGPLASATRPLAGVLGFSLVYGVVALFVLGAAAQLPAARSAPEFVALVSGSAAATALLGAFLMTRSRSWIGVAAYALLIDMGCLALTLLLPADAARQTAAAGITARLIGMLLLAISSLWDGPRAWRALAFIAGTLTLIGLPLTPGFAARWTELAVAGTGMDGIPWSLFALLGALALGAAAAVRAALRFDDTALAPGADPRWARAATAALLALTLLLGLFPQLLIEYASRVAGF